MKVSVVIPNWNGKQLLEKNLPSVFSAKNNPKNHIKEIVVVDDASTDDSVEFLKKVYSQEIRVIVQEVNRGFAHTVNAGAKTASGDLICLINNDVVVTKNFLESINDNFKDPQVFAVSLHEKGFGPAKGKFENGFIVHVGQKESSEIQNTFWASGGSGVFRKDLWTRLKGMDSELLPFYWEDIDLSYRAQKRGYKILWDPKAIVIHNHESTYKKLDQKMLQRSKERNYLLFNWKNLTSGNLFSRHLRGLLSRILLHPGYIKVVFYALLTLPDLLKARKMEKQQSVVEDEKILRA